MAWVRWSWNRRFGTGWSSCRQHSSPKQPSTSTCSPSRGCCWASRAPRQLDGKLREVRFYLHRDAVRVTYWIASGRRIILLTVFRKARMREEREVGRARRALARCQDEALAVDEEG